MNAAQVSFEALFQRTPVPTVVFDARFRIVAANAAYFRATSTTRDIIGKVVFDVFPTIRDDPQDGDRSGFRASLERVLATGEADAMPVTRYDIPRPEGEGGGLEERHWAPSSYPVLGDDGRVAYIVHETEDVTELVRLRRQEARQAEELAEARSVYEAIYDQGIFAGRLDLDGRVIDSNAASVEQCGYTREDVIGKHFWDCGWWNRSPEVRDRVRRAVERAARGERFRGVSPYYRADGTERIVEFACIPIQDERGEVRLVVPTGIDITERTREESDRRAASILESITDAFFSLDREWRFTYLNAQTEPLLRRGRGDLLGRVVWDEFPAAIGTKFETEYRAAMRERRSVTFEEFYPAPLDRWYEVNAYPTDEGLAVYFRDVTERKRSEEEFARLTAESDRQRRIYEAALSNTPDLVYIFDLEHRFTYANEALLAMWGRTREDSLGKTCLELGYEPWHAEMHDREIDQVVATRRPIRGEVPFTGTNGRRIYDYIFVPVLGADGSVVAVAGTTRDVTERQEAEAALRRSEGRLAAALAVADLGTFEWDLRTNAVTLDGRSREIFGFAPDGEIAAGDVFGRIDPADVARVAAEAEASRENQARLETEYRLRLPDGTSRSIISINEAILGPDGQAERMIGVFGDITGRRRDEEALRKSEAKLRFLATLDAETRALTDPDGVTAVTARLLGDHLGADRCAYAEVEDESVFIFTGDHTRDVPSIVGRWPVAAFGRECARNMLANDPYVVVDAEADPRVAPEDRPAYRATDIRAVICVPLHKGGKLTAAMAVHQKTPRRWTAEEVDLVQFVASRCWESLERTRAERNLRESEERYRNLAENVPQLFWTCLPDGHCDYLSRQWVEYTGIAQGEQLGFEWLRLVVHPDDRERTAKIWMDSVQDRAAYDVNYRIRGGDGSYRWFKTRGTPIRDASGTIVKWFGTCTDIDAQVKAEESLRESDRRKDEFLAMLAHELRNPLSAIGNAIQVVRRSPAQEHLEWAKEVVDKHVKSLTKMIDDLLDISRITRGKIDLERQVLEVLPVVADAVETVRALVEERGHDLTISHSSAPMWVEADPHRFEQVLVNLLTNAAKYTEAGGRITLRARPDGDSIAISVVDNGSGIPPEKIPEMFELFAQGDRSIARSEGGLGIGLTLVKNLVEMHGGSVTARSEGIGRGSEFTVRLPSVKPPRPGRQARKPEAVEQPAKASRVLVVDDNEDSARGLVRLLKILGHDVKSAHDGPSAIEAALAHRPEFVLLDIGLPGMDGYQVAERLRAEGFRDTTIIAVSGYGEEAARRRSREAGFDHHLVKPVDYDTLVALMRKET